MPRRPRFDPLAVTHHPHWLTVSDLHRNLITSQPLLAGADLRKTLQGALAQCAAEGWQPESDGAYGFVFVAKAAERRLVNLTPADPAIDVGSGHAFLAGLPANGGLGVVSGIASPTSDSNRS